MEEKPQVYHCLLCGYPLIFNQQLITLSIQTTATKQSPRSNDAITPPDTIQPQVHRDISNILFDEDISQPFDISFTSSNESVDTFAQSFQQTYTQSLIQDRSLSCSVNDSNTFQQIPFSTTPLPNIKRTRSALTHKSTKTNTFAKRSIPKSLPMYLPSVINPIITMCESIGLEFPICSRCYQLIDSSMTETLSLLSVSFKQQRIKYKELIEFTITNTLDEDIKRESEAVKRLTEEVVTLQLNNQKQKDIVEIIKNGDQIFDSYYNQHCSEINQCAKRCSSSIQLFNISKDQHLKEEYELFKKSSAGDHLFRVEWIEFGIIVNDINLIETIKKKNERHFSLAIHNILEHLNLIARRYHLVFGRYPKITVKKPDDIFRYLFKCLVICYKYLTCNENESLVIPYAPIESKCGFEKAKLVPIEMNNLSEFDIAIKFFMVDLVTMREWALSSL
ncbi:Atg6 BARA domain-containing protein [Entamoeba marina]